MSAGFRQSQATLHTWSGLLMGWVLFIVFMTGTTAFWREPLNRWMQPEMPRVEQPIAVLGHAQSYLENTAPKAKSWFITMANEKAPGAYIFWVPQPDPDAPARRGGRGRNSALIGADGQTAQRDTRGGDFFYRFHFDLHYMPVFWARWLVGAATLMMLVAILSGIVTHKKIFRDFFTLRRARGQRSWLDGHNATAVLGLPFHLMITYTGLVTLASMLMPWALQANFPDEFGLYGVINPAPETVERSGEPAPLHDLTAIARDAQLRLGGPVGAIEVSEPGDRAARIVVTAGSTATLNTYGARLRYDGVTGDLLWRAPPPSAADTTFGAMIGLHAGRFGDVGMRWVYFLAGIGGTIMVASGLVLWTVKRRRKLPDPDKPRLGFWIVERLNIATVGGFPLGCAAFLFANRIVPIGVADRAEMEIAILFYVWGAAALFALIAAPRIAWTVLLYSTAAALLATPLYDAVLLEPSLSAWVRQEDWTMIGVELVLLALSAGFACTARAVARHRKEPAPRSNLKPHPQDIRESQV